MPDFGVQPIPGSKDEPTTDKPKGVDPSAVASFKPAARRQRPINLSDSDKVAEGAGFTSREPGPKVVPYVVPRKKKRVPEQPCPLSMRAPLSVVERFLRYAEKYNLSNPLALERLLDVNDLFEKNGGEL
jgi:hypothetical protein